MIRQLAQTGCVNFNCYDAGFGYKYANVRTNTLYHFVDGMQLSFRNYYYMGRITK